MRPVLAIALDCDGVILDANQAKSQAFAAVARQAGCAEPVVDAFMLWQRENFGRSRFQAFAALVAGEFGVVPASLDASALVDAYAHAVDQIYSVVPETQHIREFLGVMRDLSLFVVSGSEQAQLRDHLARRGLAGDFDGIYGSPASKVDLLAQILAGPLAGISPTQLLFVGDAVADARAAYTVGCEFIGLDRYASAPESLRVVVAETGATVVGDLDEVASRVLASATTQPLRHPSRGF